MRKLVQGLSSTSRHREGQYSPGAHTHRFVESHPTAWQSLDRMAEKWRRDDSHIRIDLPLLRIYCTSVACIFPLIPYIT
jgi:hypothetical protein